MKAAIQLHIDPKDCIVFEDSLAGIKAANIASMVSIGIGKEDTLKDADHVFKDFTEISNEFLNELIKEKRT